LVMVICFGEVNLKHAPSICIYVGLSLCRFMFMLPYV
jgi:hypothetical protein